MDPALAREASVLAQTRVINEAIARGDSEIQQFYKDATVFITGGTGFMGKQMIEKLFRSCDIKKVFLLMRHKKNKSFHERLDNILQDPVFDQVNKMKPGFEKKIFPVQGDAAEMGLGISKEDLATIIEETEIIFHGAATVNFDEPLKVAVNTNVRGTVEMLNLGKQCKKLKSYVHISTAFAHCTYSRINQEVCEQFYEAPLSPEAAMTMVSTMEEKILNNVTPEIIKNWPNTYTYTKAIAEEACRQASSDLPISIVRPAVVISSLKEPSPGWLDLSCAYGPSGFVLGYGLGVMHVLMVKKHLKVDIVPVDLVNNAIIAAGWASAKRQTSKNKAKIYTVTSRSNYIHLDDVIATLTNEGAIKYVSPKTVYCIFLYQTNNRFMYKFLTWLWHYIPGYIIDFVLTAVGKSPIGVKIYSKVEKHGIVLSYFTTNEWLCRDRNLQELHHSLNATDKQIFNFDVHSIDWKELAIFWLLGVRKYIIKDGLQGTACGNKNQFWLKILHNSVVAPLYFFLLFKMATATFAPILNTIRFIIKILRISFAIL